MTVDNVALVFGASGISGWAMTKNLLLYPAPTTFSRVIALTHRPLKIGDSGLPPEERLELLSGVNLRSSLEEVKKSLKEKVDHLEDVTHVYYLAYSNATAYTEKVMEIRDINVGMTGNAVRAVDALCPKLKSVVLQTGTNNYGVACFQHIDKIELSPPLKESNPRIPSPYGDEIFYYPQVDLLRNAARGKSWSWCEVRPDQIIGYVPNATGMSFLEPLALYLSLYRYVNGCGATVPFPGTKKNWSYTFTDTSQDIMTRFEIFASLRPEETKGEAYNIADSPRPSSWSEKWLKLCSSVGLKGAGPKRDDWEPIDEWWEAHAEDYKAMVKEFGLKSRAILPAAWTFVRAGFTLLDRNRELDLSKSRQLGFREELEPGYGHYVAFQRMTSFIPQEYLDKTHPMYIAT